MNSPRSKKGFFFLLVVDGVFLRHRPRLYPFSFPLIPREKASHSNRGEPRKKRKGRLETTGFHSDGRRRRIIKAQIQRTDGKHEVHFSPRLVEESGFGTGEEKGGRRVGREKPDVFSFVLSLFLNAEISNCEISSSSEKK